MSGWTYTPIEIEPEVHKELLAQFQKIVGVNYVSDEVSRCEAYSADFGIVPRHRPHFVIRPSSTEEIQAIINVASRYHVPLIPRGAGTAQEGGSIPAQGGILLDLTRLNAIIRIDENTGCVTVQAGIVFAKLIDTLDKLNLKIGISPSGSLSGTVGGHLAKAGVGWGNILYGTQGDQVIGVKAVLPSGEVIQTGSGIISERTFVRYVLGPDLTGFFVGSEGALGVITELTLAMYPKPECTKLERYWLKDISTAMEIFRRISHQKLAVYISLHQSYPDIIFDVVFEGTQGEVNDRIAQTLEWVQELQGHQVEWKAPETVLKDRFWEFALEYRRGIGAMVCFFAPFDESVEANQCMREIIDKFGIHDYGVDMYPTLTLMEHAIGMYFREDDVNEREKIRSAADAVMKEAIKRGWPPYTKGRQWGHILPSIIGETIYWKTLLAIKKTLDPQNIMNPGVLGLPPLEKDIP